MSLIIWQISVTDQTIFMKQSICNFVSQAKQGKLLLDVNTAQTDIRLYSKTKYTGKRSFTCRLTCNELL